VLAWLQDAITCASEKLQRRSYSASVAGLGQQARHRRCPFLLARLEIVQSLKSRSRSTLCRHKVHYPERAVIPMGKRFSLAAAVAGLAVSA
jgi:hypothetical protein